MNFFSFLVSDLSALRKIPPLRHTSEIRRPIVGPDPSRRGQQRDIDWD